MSYYAQFDSHSNAVFRLDTRIYLTGHPASRTGGKCVAAIVGKNPGSASSTTIGTWRNLELTGDKMLPSVRNRFIEAYDLAGKTVPKDDFVQVWNLFYLCGKNLDSALDAIAKISPPLVCSTEGNIPRIVWFAWGGDNKHLNPFKMRFSKMRAAHTFFFDKQNERICTGCPAMADFAKHPQGLRAEPIVEHLAKIL